MTVNEQFQPQWLDNYIGQAAIQDRIDVAMWAALIDHKPLDHILLTGGEGAGKSTLAHLLSREMEQPLVVVADSPTPKRLGRLLYDLEEGGILFLDEVHMLSRATENAVLCLVESRTFNNNYGAWPLPNLTVIAATTEPEKLNKPFISRFPLNLHYEAYSDAEMEAMVRQFAGMVELELPDETCAGLAVAAAGKPRTARSFVIAARSLCLAARTYDADTVLKFVGVEADGLTKEHMAYLRALTDNSGQAGIEALCTRLRLNRALVVDLERLLLDRKMVTLAPEGRVLTPVGHRRLAA